MFSGVMQENRHLLCIPLELKLARMGMATERD